VHLLRCRPADEDACQVNGFAMFCHFTSTALGLPTVTDGHAPNFSSCSGAFLIGLRQWRADRNPRLFASSTTVRVECDSTTHLPSETD